MYNDYDPNNQEYCQQPLYEQKNLPDPLPIFIMGIIGLGLTAFSFYSYAGIIYSIAGLVVSAITLSKVKAYVASGGILQGKASIGKTLATIGLAVGITGTAVSLLIILFYILYFVFFFGIFALAIVTQNVTYY